MSTNTSQNLAENISKIEENLVPNSTQINTQEPKNQTLSNSNTSNSQNYWQNETQANPNKFRNNWPKQLYYYIILAGCIFSLAIGSFTFLRANLVRFVFPEVDNYSYQTKPSEIESRCRYKSTSDYGSSSGIEKSSIPTSNMPILNSQEEFKICEQKIKDDQNMETNRRYQQEMLNSILTIVIASLVLFGHLHFFKKLEV